MDHKMKDGAGEVRGVATERAKQPEPNFDKPLGSSHNDQADLRDVAQGAAKKSR
jgi:hypothetical protein